MLWNSKQFVLLINLQILRIDVIYVRIVDLVQFDIESLIVDIGIASQTLTVIDSVDKKVV